MLGLSTGIIWDSSIKLLSEPPQDNLVGHWDFTDVTQLKGSLSGSFSGSALSGGDKIGRCKNKAPNIDGSGTHHLGQWVRAVSNDTRPTWLTGGANSKAYASFDNSSYTQALVCRSTDGTNWCGNGTDILSQTTRLKAEDLSIFIVGEPLDDDTDGSPEDVFSYFAYYDRPSGFNDSEYIAFTFERDDDDDMHAKWVLGSHGVVSPNSVDATNVINHWNSGGASIINLQTSLDVGKSYIYTNNVPDVGQTIFHPASTGGFAQNNWADFDPVNYDDSLTVSIGIGGTVNSSGALASDSFEGKIYEILVYKEALSESDRSALTHYLGYKYNIDVTT